MCLPPPRPTTLERVPELNERFVRFSCHLRLESARNEKRTKRSFCSGTLSLLLRATPREAKVIRESCGSQRTHELPRERLAGRIRKVGGSLNYFSAHSHSEKSTTYAQKAVILQKLSLGELQSQV